MIYNITSSIDSTMYEQYENRNTGIDEVLQIDKIISESSTNNTFNSRILTKFDLGYISQSILDGHIKDTFRAKLKFYTHAAVAIPYTYEINAYAVSQSWEMGIGRSTHNPKTNEGVSWTYRDGESAATAWQTASAALTAGTTASFVMELTINGIDYVPVISASLFDNNDSEFFVQISSSTDLFGTNLASIINASSSLTNITASYNTSSATPASTLLLSGSSTGINVTITTSSISGNNQSVFISSVGNYSVQGATSTTTTPFAAGTSGSLIASGITEGGGEWYIVRFIKTKHNNF